MRYIRQPGTPDGPPVLWRAKDEKALNIDHAEVLQSDPYEIWQPVDSPVAFTCTVCFKVFPKGGLRFVGIGGQGFGRGDMSLHIDHLKRMHTRVLERVKCPDCRWSKHVERTEEEKLAEENRPKRKTSLDD